MKVVIGWDRGAETYKKAVAAELEKQGYTVRDFGPDCPDFGAAAAQAVAEGSCDKGVLLGSSGIFLSIAANKTNGIRCALLSDVMTARMTREHNDTNMMALGTDVVGPALALEIVNTWVNTPFSGGERHQRRVDKIMALEEK